MSRSSGLGTFGTMLLAAVALYLSASPPSGNGETVAPGPLSVETPSNKKAAPVQPPAHEQPAPAHGGFSVARLLNQYFGGALPDAGQKSDDWQATLKAAIPKPTDARIDWLIQLIPNPLTTDMDLLTDDALDALQQGALALGYSLDRYELPWNLAEDKLWHVQPNPDAKSAFGVVLFRKRPVNKDPSAGKNLGAILVVLIVPETPTSGVDARALTEALDVVVAARSPESTTCTINVQGPLFSGSAQSVRQGVVNWWGQPTLNASVNVDICFLSGTATAVDNKTLLTILPTPNDREKTLSSRFFATVLPIALLIDQLDKCYLRRRGFAPGEIAILSESDTTYGAGSLDETSPRPGNERINRLRFPMHIGALRTAYAHDAHLLLGKQPGPANEPRLSLDLSLQNTNEARNLLPLLTSTTIRKIEASLITELHELYQRRMRVVVIVATDARDQVFLTQLVKMYAPQTLIVLVAADSLFVHDISGVNLDDVLVATTYPLTPSVQRYVGSPHGDATWTVFRNQQAEGIYNAVVGLLGGSIVGGQIGDSKLLWDYDSPFGTSITPNVKKLTGPPLWVTAIRHNQFWPVEFCPIDCATNSYTLPATGNTSSFSKPSYDPDRYISLAVIAAVFSAWAICRCAFYLSIQGWTTAAKEFPALVISSLWELVALATISWLLFAPFLFHWAIHVHNADPGGLYSNWSWCLFAVLLLTTSVITSCGAIAHAAFILSSWFKLLRGKRLLAGLAAFMLPTSAFAASLSCFTSLDATGISIAVVAVVALCMGIVPFLSKRARRPHTFAGNILASCFVLFAMVAIGTFVLWLALTQWPTLTFLTPDTLVRAPFTCDRMYHITSGVSPLAPLLLLCLGIALVAGSCTQRALLRARWNRLAFLPIDAVVMLGNGLNGQRQEELSITWLRVMTWSPLALLIGILLAQYGLHSVGMLDGVAFKWIAFGMILFMMLALIVATGRFYELAHWLLSALKLLATAPLAAALSPKRLPAKLCKEVEGLFFGVEPTLLDMGPRAIELQSLLQPDPDSKKQEVCKEIVEMANCALADRNLDALSTLWKNMAALYAESDTAVNVLWVVRKKMMIQQVSKQTDRLPDTESPNIAPEEFSLDLDGAWSRVVALEDLMAMLVVMQIRTALCCLRKLLYGVFIISMSLAFAVEAYPFLPRTPLAMAAICIPLFAFSMPLLRLFIELSKDQMLSQISGSNEQRVDLSGKSLLNVFLLLAVPLLSGLIYQFPALAKPLYSLRDLISHVQK